MIELNVIGRRTSLQYLLASFSPPHIECADVAIDDFLQKQQLGFHLFLRFGLLHQRVDRLFVSERRRV